MYPYIYLFDRPFSTYGVMALIGGGFVIGYSALANRKSSTDFYSRFIYLVYAFCGSFLCAALLYQFTAIKNWIKAMPYLFTDFDVFKSYMSFGIVYYGGLIGIFIGMMIYTKQFKEDTREWLYSTVPSIPLFHIFGRIGCALGGCCYGIEVTNGGIYNALIDKYCLPIQLYESFGDLIIFIVLLTVSLRQKDKSRYYLPMGLYFILYGILRFVLEFWRGDRIRGIWGAFSTSQYISMIIVPLGIYCLICPTEKNFFEKMYSAPQKIKSGNAQSVQQ